MKCHFENIEEFFLVLNQANINYLVLRNFENLLEPKLYVDGHSDIDLLCESARTIVELVDARPIVPDRSKLQDDGIHYLIQVAGQPVQLDLRQVGDGYYCTKWQKNLLERKVMNNGFYVMTDEDYFFTLAYHAILQKRSLSREYFIRLCDKADELDLNVDEYSESGLLRLLENHMREHGYRFTYSHDLMVPNRFGIVDGKLIDKDFILWLKHLGFDLRVTAIQLLVWLKHALKLK